jgi:hypothetical protein
MFQICRFYWNQKDEIEEQVVFESEAQILVLQKQNKLPETFFEFEHQMKMLALDRDGTLLVLSVDRSDLNAPLSCKSIKLSNDKKIRNLIQSIGQKHYGSVLLEEEMITAPEHYFNPTGSSQMTDYFIETGIIYHKQYLGI